MTAPALTLQDYEEVILYLAECVLAHGERFAPFLDKMIAARDRMATRQDPVAKARAIIEEARRRQAP